MASPLAAQNALDRTVPSQEVARGAGFVTGEQTLRIEFEPVIETPESDDDGDPIAVSGIMLDGLDAVSAESFADVIEEFAGRGLTRGDLARLTNRLAKRARDEGLIFATVWIPEQTMLAGILRVTIDEGRIDEIRVTGIADPVVAEQLASLKDGKPVMLAALQRQLLLAADIPGITIRSSRFVREGERRILLVEAEHDRINGSALIANDGIKPIGPVRARIDVNVNGLISARDNVELSFSVTPFDPRELAFVAGRYSVIINDAGTSLGLSGAYSKTRPGAYLADLDLSGEFWQAGVGLRHPLIRTPRRSLWLDGSLGIQELTQDSFALLARQDRIVAARLGIYGFSDLAGGTVQARATVAQGLDVFGATPAGDPFASRLDAAPDFTTFSWWVDWQRRLGGRFSLSLAATGQLSTAPLLIGENFILGGTSFLRGYDFGQRAGDQGIIGQGELRYDLANAFGAGRGVQLYAFADGGTVSDLNTGTPSATLASSGAGVRADVTRQLDLDFEVAVPLSEVRFDTGDNSPRVVVRVRQAF